MRRGTGGIAVDAPSLVEWGAAGRALDGQPVSGDGFLVKPHPSGVLLAVTDGLGHGREAARASAIALATLEASPGLPVAALVERCHQELLGTRGVVLSVASIDAGAPRMEWLGVGNVEGYVWQVNGGGEFARQSLMLRGGVAGFRLPPLRPAWLPIAAGATIVFVTDGIRASFVEGVCVDASPQEIADAVLADYGRASDDALVLAARYVGGAQ